MKESDEGTLSLQGLGIDLNEPMDRPNHRLWLGALIAGSTVLGTLALMAPFVLSRSPLPYMATPGHKIRKALEFIQAKSGREKPGTFVDLGSGDGEGVYQALRVGYQQAVGIEMNLTLCILSRIRRQFFWENNLRRRSHFLNQDFFRYSLTQADTCMIFGVTPLMEPISRKLALECSPGTHVLAYRFKLPLATGSKRRLLSAEIVYDVEEMRVYECR